MGKALLVTTGGSVASGNETNLFGNSSNATETNSQYSATEGADFTGLGYRIASGGSGSNTVRFRDNGANGQNVAVRSGTGTADDTTHTDTLTAGDLFNLAMTNTGTNPIYSFVRANVEFASGHGSFHGALTPAGVVCDVASSTQYLPINGNLSSDGNPTIAQVQWKNRGYTSLEGFQVRVTANARVNDSVFSININGSDVGTPITFSAGATGLQTVTGMGIGLADGDLVCVSMALGSGVEDLTVSLVGATMKSANGESEVCAASQSGTNKSASGTPSYFAPGGGALSNSAEANTQVRVGFAARVRNFRCYIRGNTFTGDGTLTVRVNGVDRISITIPAGGADGWLENSVDTYDIAATDVVQYKLVGGTSGSIWIHSIGITFGSPPVAYDIDADPGTYTILGTSAGLEFSRMLGADGGTYALSGTDVTLSRGREVIAETGAYTLSGSTAALEYDRLVDALAGAYTITGGDAALEMDRVLSAETVAYVLDGTDATLQYGADLSIDAEGGVYNFTGVAATLSFLAAIGNDADWVMRLRRRRRRRAA